MTRRNNTSFRLKRVGIIGIICIVMAILIIGINIITDAKWYEYITCVALIITGLIFIYTSNKIRMQKIKKK